MISFKQYIIEAFDKPYKWRAAGKHTPEAGILDHQAGNFSGKLFKFRTENGRRGEVYIYEYDIKSPKVAMPIFRNPGRVMEMHFSVGSIELYGDVSAEITGEGDALRIFATVLDIIEKYVKKNKPEIIKVMGAKTKDDEIGSRLYLYERLVKRYGKKLGYEYEGGKMWTMGDQETESGLGMSIMTLIKKGFKRRPDR